MYREDRYLELADLKLRVFIEYCKELPDILEEYYELNDRLYTIGSSSFVNLTETKFGCDLDILELLELRDEAAERCVDRMNFIKPIAKVLTSLTSQDISLLSDRYEEKMTLRELGDKYHYSYMNMARYLDRIIIKFK